METNNKDRIINEFIRLTNQENFSKIHISNICNNLNINRKLFYYYFDDKYELLKFIYLRDLQNTFPVSQNVQVTWPNNARKMLTILKNKNRFYQHCLNNDNSLWEKIFTDHMQRHFSTLFIDLNTDKSQVNLNFYARFYANGWTGLIKNWLLKGCPTNESDLINQFYDLIGFTKNYLTNLPTTRLLGNEN